MRALLLAAAFGVALAAGADATHCGWAPSTPEVETPATGVSYATLIMGDEGDNSGIYYVDNDLCQPKCAASVWIYEETNGVPGLQRGDEIWEPCTDLDPDTIIL